MDGDEEEAKYIENHKVPIITVLDKDNID